MAGARHIWSTTMGCLVEMNGGGRRIEERRGGRMAADAGGGAGAG
jgi:hypothetical protein